MKTVPDFIIADLGHGFKFTPQHDAATAWLKEYTDFEDWEELGDALCVGHNSAAALKDGITASGFRVAFI